ncbi:hypothetical protein D3C76_1238970 [compost metagenome]
MAGQVLHGLQCRGLAGQVHAQQVRQLAQGDDDGGAEGEAEHHGMGDEIDQRAEAQKTQQQLEDAAKEGQQQHQGNVVGTAGDGQRTDAGVEHDGNGRGRATDQVPGRAPQAGDQHRHDGGVQAVFSGQAGDQGVGDRLRQSQDRTAEADQQVLAQATARLPGEPGEERQQVGQAGHGDLSKVCSV